MLTKIIPHPGNRLFKIVIDTTDALVGNYAESCSVAVPIIWIKKNEVCLQSCQIDTFYKYWTFLKMRGVILQMTGNVPDNNCKLSFT